MDQAQVGDSGSPSNSSGNSPEGQGQDDQPAIPEKTREKNANRACEACRRLKVRCLPPPSDQPDQKCKRCAKNDQECIFLPRSRTRRRKRIDTRVGELENQIKALSSHFQKQGNASEDFKASLAAFNDVSTEIGRLTSSTATPNATSRIEQRPLERLPGSFLPGADTRKSSNPFSPDDVEHADGSRSSLADDVVGRGFLSMKDAAYLYQKFTDDAVQHCSIVIAPKGLSAMEARRSKPMLFLAIIAAMAATNDNSLGYRLNQELTKVYADRVFLQGERSLETMQSLIISAYWHFPPERYEQLKYSQYIHMATTMALDSSLGEPLIDVPTMSLNSSAMLEMERRMDGDDLERRRTWLACYVTCASLSITLKRPSMLAHSAYTAECMRTLSSSPEAAPYDNRTVAWARLQHIMEPLNIASLSSVNASSYLADPRTRSLFGGIRRRLRTWDLDFPLTAVGPALRVTFHHYKLCLLEIVLHADHDLEDFRPPFRLRKSRVRRDETMNSLDPIYSEAVADCLSSAHSILDLFNAMAPQTIRSLPTVIHVRAIYAVVVLIKLMQSATDSSSQLGPFVDLQSIHLDHYMNRLYNHLLKVSDHGKCHIGNKFLGTLIAIRAWCCKVVSAQNANGEQIDELIEPLLHLSIDHDPQLCPRGTLSLSEPLDNKRFPPQTAPSNPIRLSPLQKHTTAPGWEKPQMPQTQNLSKKQPKNTSPLPTAGATQSSAARPSSNVQYFIPNPNFPYGASLPDFSLDQNNLQTSPSSSDPFSFNPTPTSSTDVPMDPFPSEPTADYYTTEYSLDQMEGWVPDLEFIEGLDLSSYIQPTNTQEWAGFPQTGS